MSTINYPINVISKESNLIYVGVTKQSLSTRLRYVFRAKGTHGYHGYAWRRNKSILRLDVWALSGVSKDNASNELETIEAECVLFFRNQSGQWPLGQTEIHFHPSEVIHREYAKRIIESFI